MEMSINFMLLSALCTLQIEAFWWPATTTEAPATSTTTTVLKEIPLTYFRTYTYQPLAGNPFTFPFSFGFGAAQTPLLSSARYDPYASSYPPTTYGGVSANDVPIPILNMAQIMRPAAALGSSSSGSSKGSTSKLMRTTGTTTTTTTPRPPPPTTTSTTTTTTTTTTPPPPPPTTTSTTTTTTTSRPPPTLASRLLVETPLSDYANYNRRVYQVSNDGFGGSYYTRPQYPYPDYFNYQPQQQTQSQLSPHQHQHQQQHHQQQQQSKQQQQQHLQQQNLLFQSSSPQSNSRIQFVPCMCPVSVSLTASGVGTYDTRSASIIGSPIIALSEGTVQARTEEEDEDIDDEINELSEVVRQHFAEPNTAKTAPSTQVPYPTTSTSSTSASSSSSATNSGLSLTSSISPSSLSKIIIEALPTITSVSSSSSSSMSQSSPSSSSSLSPSTQASFTQDPKEFSNEQVAPEDILVLTAETEADTESLLS